MKRDSFYRDPAIVFLLIVLGLNVVLLVLMFVEAA